MSKYSFYAVVLLFSIIWSSAFIAGSVIIRDIDPFSGLVLRFILSSILLLPFCLLRKEALMDRGVIRAGLMLGVLNNSVYLGLTFSSLYYITPGWVTIITSCSPFVTSGLAVLFRLERTYWYKLLGMAAGFAGVVVMTGVTGLGGDSLYGLALAIGGTLAFSMGTVLFRGKTTGMPLASLNFWMSVSGAICLLPISLTADSSISNLSWHGALAVGWLSVVTILGMGLWFMLIRMRGASTAASYHLLSPVSALVLSHFILGTAIYALDVAGAVLIGVGLLISVYGGEIAARFLGAKRG